MPPVALATHDVGPRRDPLTPPALALAAFAGERAPLGRDAPRRADLRGRRRFRWRRLAGELEELAAAFHRRHEELYTYARRDQEAVLVNARVAVAGVLPTLPYEPGRGAVPLAAPRTRRRIYLGDWHEVPVFDVEALCPGQIVDGPAILESATTTTLLRPVDRARSTEIGWLDIALKPDAASPP